MLALAFFQWWYTRGWVEAFKHLKSKLKFLSEFFSLGLLVRTLFKPWRQLNWQVMSDAAAGQRMKVWLDNLVSRFVGLGVRSLTLLFALISFVVVGVFSLALLIIWPALPLLIFVLIAKGLGW